MAAKVQPSKTINMGDPPCCNVGGCALSKTCLWDVRQKDTKAYIGMRHITNGQQRNIP